MGNGSIPTVRSTRALIMGRLDHSHDPDQEDHQSMLQRDPDRERPRSPRMIARDDARVLDKRFVVFKRVYRWLNLSLIQQGIWPLLIVLAGAPSLAVPALPWNWWLARAAGPVLASVLALVYLAQPPPDAASISSRPTPAGVIARQARLLLPGIALALIFARLAIGPLEPAARVIGFGFFDVLAFQLIHFGVVARSWSDEEAGAIAAVGLFGASWGLGRVFLTAAGPDAGADLVLTFLGGAVVGLAIGLVSWGLRRWPGGFWTAVAAHLTLVYLIAAFV